MKKEYNLLTKKLLEEGYTAECHPEYVEVCRSAWGKELWQNLAGGFVYTRECLKSMVFCTGCGLLVNGTRFSTGSMSYMGIDWIPENDNPVITCPYKKDACSLRNPILKGPEGGAFTKVLQCDCHRTDEPYDYERSLDKAMRDEDEERARRYRAYSEKVKGHVCHWHMHYDYWKGTWKQIYDPMECARHCMNVGGVCDLTHEPVSKKKGNVFYDVRKTYIRQDGTLFDGEEVVTIEKGIRLFETARSITICEQVVKRCKKDIVERVTSRYHTEIALNGMKVEVLNIRAEQRESRDLMQDLQDIKEGIKVVHASDLERQKKEQKKRHRKDIARKKIERLEKRILEIGYWNLDPDSLDRIHADKWLGKERIDGLERLRNQKIKEEQEKPVQLSIFDMM